MTPIEKEFSTYLVSYRHDGAEWNLELKAASVQDAQARLSKLVFGRVDGELIATVPAMAGWFAKALVAFRNAFRF
jgi:hypothetical protein